ncbi:Holliday junction branch migration protein RuvA [Cyanobacterium stanieri LEGE 03274]|uniref:Holliday junction branch migration complex subunit RuvA n=1 Tax=Cyanobacterium stanieri LEGE 03274 TaxID=1828756 RepID=A0ABR9V3S7_9CHRO|nr:Holliday junction branch migration protein RuvA [Cyanobacterium stanieri]MBE9222196.1 Holliday junction branch migration protein RuvA [Cyanobacterium stanieri LEGE 03274]
MINFLRGEVVSILRSHNKRIMLVLEVNNIGYEIQIFSRFAREIEAKEIKSLQIFTHLQIRDDQQILYGFMSTAQRDLFRQLIGVSGIGVQSAIALIDTLGLEDLVQAIVTGNIKMLSKTPGVGQKTAERIALELKTKLSQWRIEAGINVNQERVSPPADILADLEMTLLALGYTNDEIQQAISVISQDNILLKNTMVEEWIRRAISHLSADIN